MDCGGLLPAFEKSIFKVITMNRKELYQKNIHAVPNYFPIKNNYNNR